MKYSYTYIQVVLQSLRSLILIFLKIVSPEGLPPPVIPNETSRRSKKSSQLIFRSKTHPFCTTVSTPSPTSPRPLPSPVNYDHPLSIYYLSRGPLSHPNLTQTPIPLDSFLDCRQVHNRLFGLSTDSCILESSSRLHVPPLSRHTTQCRRRGPTP